jgi:hypothetical protein
MSHHNLFGEAPSFNIQNAITGVWSFITMFTYKNNYCLISGPLPSNKSMCGLIFNRWPKTIHGSCHNDQFWPHIILGIRGLRYCRYWLIGVWSEFEAPSIDFSSLVTLVLEGFKFVTWGTFVLVTVCKPTSGSIYMFEVFISVCCAFNYGIMIRANGCVQIKWGEHFHGTHWLHGRVLTWGCWSIYSIRGCIKHFNEIANNGMLRFALPLLDLWTCQIVRPDNNLENKISSSLENSKGSCSI